MSTKPSLAGYLIQHGSHRTIVIDASVQCWSSTYWRGIRPFPTREEAEKGLALWNSSSSPESHGTIIDVADAPYAVPVVVAYRNRDLVEDAARDLLWTGPPCPSTSKP